MTKQELLHYFNRVWQKDMAPDIAANKVYEKIKDAKTESRLLWTTTILVFLFWAIFVIRCTS